MTKKKINHKKIFADHGHFLAILVLFVGFAAYTITSFMGINSNYIKEFVYTNVMGGDIVAVETPVDKENPFTDLSADHYSLEAVKALYYAGVIEGYSDGTFRPDNKVNRAEFSKMLVEAADLDYTSFDPAVLANCFPDVGDLPDHWFAPSVCSAAYSGWVKGYGDSFRPEKNISRAEALKIILKAFDFVIIEEVDEIPYTDIPEGAWYLGVAVASKGSGLIPNSTLFAGDREATRGEIAQMIFNAMTVRGVL